MKIFKKLTDFINILIKLKILIEKSNFSRIFGKMTNLIATFRKLVNFTKPFTK